MAKAFSFWISTARTTLESSAPAQLQNAFRDDAHFLVRVNQRKHRLRDGDIRQFLVGALDGVLDGVGEKFKLVHQVRKFRRVDLRELQFPLRQMMQEFSRPWPA